MPQEATIIDIQSLGSNTISLLENFHRILNIIPEEQSIEPITPDTKVVDALKIMKEKNYSQLAISLNGEVLGVFSYRSFSLRLMKTNPIPPSIDNLIVENFIEQLNFRSIHDGFNEAINILDKDDALLVGNIDKLQGILSSIDILKYLYGFAKPFILISEIELTLRALISNRLNPDALKEAIKKCLSKLYNDKLPDNLDELTFSDYVAIIIHGDFWNLFEKILGEDRKRVQFRFKEMNEYRNTIFHFKRKLSEEEISDLNDHRDWLLLKMKKINATKKQEFNNHVL